jgi:hypothetical protein
MIILPVKTQMARGKIKILRKRKGRIGDFPGSFENIRKDFIMKGPLSRDFSYRRNGHEAMTAYRSYGERVSRIPGLSQNGGHISCKAEY